MATYRSPGVFIEEINTFPPSIAEVESAVPAFVGYTEKALSALAEDLTNKPQSISSMTEYSKYFGGPDGDDPGGVTINVDGTRPGAAGTKITGYSATIALDTTKMSQHILYHAVNLYFANGGTRCYIVSVGNYGKAIAEADLEGGFTPIGGLDDPTILLCPEAAYLKQLDFTSLNQTMLDQASTLKDRFAIIDTLPPDPNKTITDNVNLTISGIVNGPSQVGLQYGAVYYPWLQTAYNYNFDETVLDIAKYTINGAAVAAPDTDLTNTKFSLLKTTASSLYNYLTSQLSNYTITIPPSGAIAGVYCAVDQNIGVWKAPANVGLTKVAKATISIKRADQDLININDESGKSVNAILNSPGFGTVVMGARTLDGNDNSWRYINVRRFFIMVEESVKNSTGIFVFEPNTAPTWVKVQAMIENYLFQKWRDGALAGAKPELAYYVKVGLGQTMTAQDILEGRLIVQIGMAVARPAEFIVMQFEQQMQNS